MKKLTKAGVIKRIGRISKMSPYDEHCHMEEDELFHDFVKNINAGKYKSLEEVVEIARELYKVRDLIFDRFYS